MFSWNLPGAKVIPARPVRPSGQSPGPEGERGGGEEASLGTELALGGQVGHKVHLERVAVRGQYLLGGGHVAFQLVLLWSCFFLLLFFNFISFSFSLNSKTLFFFYFRSTTTITF